jgi:hypothetical protein
LLTPPTAALFDAIDLQTRRKPTRYEGLEQQMRDLSKRVGTMETVMDIMGRKLAQVVLDNDERRFGSKEVRV